MYHSKIYLDIHDIKCLDRPNAVCTFTHLACGFAALPVGPRRIGMRNELRLADIADNISYLSPTALELYLELQRIFKNRNETYFIPVVSGDGRLTRYSFMTWSLSILRFMSQMSIRHRYILVTVLEDDFRQKKLSRILFCPGGNERPVWVKREMMDGKVTFTLVLASKR